MSQKKSQQDRLVLIDGAGGYIGGHLVEEFTRSGYRVRATDISGADFSVAEKAGAEIIPADILKPAELKAVMSAPASYCFQFTRVRHVAGIERAYLAASSMNIKTLDILNNVLNEKN